MRILTIYRTLALLLACFVFAGCAGEPEPTPTVVVSAEIKLGQETFSANCAICHATTPDTVIRGPSMHGIARRGQTRVASQDARTYIFNSIMRPDDYLVDGFENIMPTTLAKTLTGEELDAVVAYLLTLE